MIKQYSLLLAGIVFVVLSGLAFLAQDTTAHPNDDWAVINDELHYTESSKWNLEITSAVWRWQRFDCYWDASPTSQPCSGVNVAPGNGNLHFYDINDCNAGYNGRYQSGPSPDTIELNDCYFNSVDYGNRERVTSHEIGHALKLQHPPCTDYYQKYSVMITACPGGYFQPGYHDRRDYYYHWVYYDDH